jgi:dihydrofolate reductase
VPACGSGAFGTRASPHTKTLALARARGYTRFSVAVVMATREVLAVMQMTIDGVAEWPASGDEVDQDDSDYWETLHARYWDSVDTLLLGRRTYEKWSNYWPGVRNSPDAGKYPRKFSEFADRAEKVVFSRTLESALWHPARIVRGELPEEIARLKSRPGGDMLVGGGPRLFQEFLRQGLIDDLRLALFPSVLGRGKPLFDVERLPDNPDDFIPLGSPSRHDFNLVEARPFARGGGAIFLHYSRATK